MKVDITALCAALTITTPGQTIFVPTISLGKPRVQQVKPSEFKNDENLSVETAIANLRQWIPDKKTYLDAAEQFMADYDKAITDETSSPLTQSREEDYDELD